MTLFQRRPAALLLALSFLIAGGAHAQAGDKTAAPIQKGLNVYSAGHSFHYFMPQILGDIAKKADIGEHKQLGLSAIGGSRVIQHWNVPEEKNKLKEALRAGKVDVLTLSPIHLPDEGIENFVKLAVEKNPKIRVTVQENWLPFDMYDTTFKVRPKSVDHNAPTAESLRKLHEPYFKIIDAHVRELRKKYGNDTVYVAPVGQAVIALREKILEGKAPGLKEQNDLFTDAIGHAKAPLQALVSYTHYATIYRKSPVGLPVPAILAKSKGENVEKLNRLLQELAWDAVRQHPLAGVRVEAP